MPINSLLFVPAREKMLEKIPSMSADQIVIDLEDSIENGKKEKALELVCRFLAGHVNRNIAVRVNKSRYEYEIRKLAQYEVDFMLPKVEMNSDYAEIRKYRQGHSYIALLESPLAFINIDEIARANAISALAFGAEDYTSIIGMKNDYHLLYLPKMILVNYARSYGKKVYDTPSFRIKECDDFRAEVENSFDLGFDGKMAIHPRQVDYINLVYRTYDDIERMKNIVDTFEKTGQCVCVIDGNVYEKMHIEKLKRKIKHLEE